jgi:WD40 repeat protein
VEVWDHDADKSSTRRLKTIQCHDGACRTLGFVNDGALLLTGSSDRSILATDVATGKPLARLSNAHKSAVNRISVLDRNLIASGDDDGVVKVWDTRQQTACGSFAPFVDFVSDICHVPAGAGAGESVPDPSAPGTSAAGATNGGSLVVTSGDGTVAHLSLSNWKVLGQSDNMEDELLSCCVLKNGKKCVAGSQTGMLNIFSYGEWEDFSDRFPGHPSSIDAIVKVDEETILTGSSDGIVRVISVLPNKMLGIVGEHGDMPLERMALRDDNSLLATASHDKTIKLWDVKYLWETDLRAGGGGVEMEGRGELDSDDDDDSDDDEGGGKRKRKKKGKKGGSKVQGSTQARATAKKQAAKKFFDGL